MPSTTTERLADTRQDDLLIIFARYPEAGNCKTRLIPQLGAEGAAAFYASMVRHTLKTAARLAQSIPCQIRICFTGSTHEVMAAEFGHEFDYQPQSEGCLGKKMSHAVQSGFCEGYRKIIVVGTDCPQLNEITLARVFSTLDHHQVTFVPASDGGYVAIGLSSLNQNSSFCGDEKQMLHACFEDIEWSTGSVLPDSLERLSALPAKFAVLERHADVDTPEDLAAAEIALESSQPTAPTPPTISIVIPVGKQEPQVNELVKQLTRIDGIEVILAATPEVAATWAELVAEHPVQCIGVKGPRSTRMNQASVLATGNVLLFLHADTQLPADFESAILNAVAEKECRFGAFALKIDGRGPLLRLVELAVWLRSQWLKLPYGDQAIFAERQFFQSLGGYDESLPIMEDYEFVRRARKSGKLEMLKSTVTTSQRRWQRLGVIRTTLINQVMVIGFRLGFKPEQLAAYYRKPRTRTDPPCDQCSD